MDTRLRILKEAGILFSRLGIKSVTMDYIANHLGVSKRTIYELFSDKDDLLSQAFDEFTKFHRTEMFNIIEESENVIEAIVNFSRLHNEMLSKIHPLFMSDLKKYHNKVYKNLVKTGMLNDEMFSKLILTKGVEEGVFRSDIDIKLANVFFLEAMRFCFNKNNKEMEGFSTDQIVKTVFLPYLRGISTEKGLDILKNANFENLQ
ncbi:MAG: TetR/AcrR family transcriptional regulator [Bacteroidales bacterium]|nr:TetR/AcrR family transcriptional regulator [Bacteroidales bacterium]